VADVLSRPYLNVQFYFNFYIITAPTRKTGPVGQLLLATKVKREGNISSAFASVWTIERVWRWRVKPRGLFYLFGKTAPSGSGSLFSGCV
jgi:hypothetical protein